MNGMNDGGWIKLHRRFLRSAIWQNPNIARFWTWCLLKATHDGYTATIGFKRIVLGPGQFLYNHSMACIDTGLSQKTVRNCLEFLKSGDTPEIGQNRGSLRGNRFSIITINNWDTYQAYDSGEGNHGAGKRASKGQTQGSLYYKEGKNVKKYIDKSPPVDVVWNGEKLEVPEVLLKKYRQKFPLVDIDGELLDAEAWLMREPKRASEIKSFGLFLTRTWFKNAKTNQSAPDDGVYEASPQILADFEELVCKPNREREGLVIIDGKLVKKEDARNEHGDGATGTVSA